MAIPSLSYRPSAVGDPFRILAVTLPDIMPGEARLIELMLRGGIRRVHLRKPSATEAELESLLSAIPAGLLPRISLHDHHRLARVFGTGVHLNARNPEPPEGFRGTLSRSCHSPEELAVDPHGVDYSFLSPVYDSISKQGYNHSFDIEALSRSQFIDSRVIALGGVTPGRFSELASAGFGGAAMLGYLWGDLNHETIKHRIDAAIHHQPH